MLAARKESRSCDVWNGGKGSCCLIRSLHPIREVSKCIFTILQTGWQRCLPEFAFCRQERIIPKPLLLKGAAGSGQWCSLNRIFIHARWSIVVKRMWSSQPHVNWCAIKVPLLLLLLWFFFLKVFYCHHPTASNHFLITQTASRRAMSIAARLNKSGNGKPLIEMLCSPRL